MDRLPKWQTRTTLAWVPELPRRERDYVIHQGVQVAGFTSTH